MTAFEGSDFSRGTIYTIDSSGLNFQKLYDFPFNSPSHPEYGSLIEGANGKLFGLTSGAALGDGAVIEFDTTSAVLKEGAFFNNYLSTGSSPMGSLIFRPDGDLLGMTPYGGDHGGGIIFSYDTVTNLITKEFSFFLNIGITPMGSLLRASDGYYYGTLSNCNGLFSGSIFKYDDSLKTVVYSTNLSHTTGIAPRGSLIEASNGKLYGMTHSGGADSVGIIFSFDISTNTLQKCTDFHRSLTGAYPMGDLLQCSNGKIYGMTSAGGDDSCGVLFEFDPVSNSIIKLYDFHNVQGKGNYPKGSLIEWNNNKLLGLTSYGHSNWGTVFEYDTVTHDLVFTAEFTGDNGMSPQGSLMIASNGKMYGMTTGGGLVNSSGTLFEYDPWNYQISAKLYFGSGPYGIIPEHKLVYHPSGKFYGSTFLGGIHGDGVLFSFDGITHEFNVHHHFNRDDSIGAEISGELLLASNGNFYFPAYSSITQNGTLLKFDPLTEDITVEHYFDTLTGRSPSGDLLEYFGKIYGTVVRGGNENRGGIYSFDPLTGQYDLLIQYTGYLEGTAPSHGLINGANGYLYITYDVGGNTYHGAISKFDPASLSISNIYDFNGTDGYKPSSKLSVASDGNLYGVTEDGGTYGHGTLYSINSTSDLFTKHIDFDSIFSGYVPRTSLLATSAGTLLGTTAGGGSNGKGLIFQYDIISQSILPFHEFDYFSGNSPRSPLTAVESSTMSVPSLMDENKYTLSSNAEGVYNVCNNESGFSISIYEVNGKLIRNLITDGNCLIIDLKDCVPAVYFAELVSGNSASIIKLIRH